MPSTVVGPRQRFFGEAKSADRRRVPCDTSREANGARLAAEGGFGSFLAGKDRAAAGVAHE